MEQEGDLPDPAPMEGLEGDDASSQAPMAPVATEHSPSYLYLANIVLQCFKIPIPRKGRELSDNKITNINDAFKYLDVIERFLPRQTVSKLKAQHQGNVDINDLDVADTINFANLALHSLYYLDKTNDNSDYREIANTQVLDNQNVDSIINRISGIIS